MPLATPAKVKLLELPLARGLLLRVAFDAVGGRIGHTIVLVDSTGGVPRAAPLLTSLEGTSNDPWPASPPLQSLSLEELAPGRRAALLVGMAGRSHWSASIEASLEQGAIVFDVACRASQAPARLGSTYRLDCEVALQSDLNDQPPRLMLRAGESRLSLIAEPAGEFPPPRLELRDGELHITPAVALSGRQATVRWKYRLQLFQAPTRCVSEGESTAILANASG